MSETANFRSSLRICNRSLRICGRVPKKSLKSVVRELKVFPPIYEDLLDKVSFVKLEITKNISGVYDFEVTVRLV